MDPNELMRLAIDTARQGLSKGQSPFGCAISWGDGHCCSAHNTVLASNDPTAHAEVNAIRRACREAGQIFLEGAVVATTCEPCPMCMAALHWSRVDSVHYGATIDDAASSGFNELNLPAKELLRLGGSKLTLVASTLVVECQALFDEFNALPQRKTY